MAMITLTMEAASFSETSVSTHQTIQRDIPEEATFELAALRG
jgi:hypothetical protein